ncbi:MAG: serine protease [Bacteroidota bacterium]
MKLTIQFTLLLFFLIAETSFGQESKGDSLSIKSEIILSPEIFEKAKDSPQLMQQIIEFRGDRKKLKKDFFNSSVNLMQSGIMQIQYKIYKPEIYVDKQEIYPDPTEAYDNLDYIKPVRQYDSRFEISQLNLSSTEHQNVILNSFGVLGIVSSNQLTKNNSGFSALNTTTMEQRYAVCPDEPFKDQPVLCFGTSFLVHGDIVITARHNLDIVPLKEMMFIIGYKVLLESGAPNLSFKNKDVYSAVKTIGSEKLDQLDLVLVKLDRKVESAPPLIIEKSFEITDRESIYALGHPVGLPIKYITNASVKSKENELIYYTTLDTFKGNSGSPVFNRSTHNVVGVLVEGGVDFKYNGNCYSANLCGERGCIGEKVVNISLLETEIQQLINQEAE